MARRNAANSIILLLSIVTLEAKRTKQPANYGLCTADQYRCQNEKCIKRTWFCDGSDDCGDNSDEKYCQMEKKYGYDKRGSYKLVDPPCPSHYPFHKCLNEPRCVPSVWKCDGNKDCADYSDEIGCLNDVEKISGSISAREKAITWLQSQRQLTSGNKRWGTHTPRTAIALFLSNQNYFDGSNAKGNEIAYEVENQVLANMIEDHDNDIPMNELAIYIHALLVTCVNPKDFHGIDLVARLRREADKQENYTNPLVMLALCNAGDKMTKKDVDKVTNAFYNEQRPLWKNTQALALMALSCINERLLPSSVSESVFDDMSSKLKKNQFNNGSFENMQATALVMQAIFASGKEDNDWDMDEAVKFLVKNQGSNGSYGSFLNTYYVLPVLYYKSLLNISSSHCNINSPKEDGDILFNLKKKIGKKMSIKYSLIYGDQHDLVRSLILRVTQNSTFFDVMNLAKSLDEKYSFEYNLLESKPYVYSVDGFEEDPENENYWFLYKAGSAGFQDGTAIHLSPIDVIPKDGEEYAMWYRRGHWSQNSEAFAKHEPLTDPKHLDEKHATLDNATTSYKSTTSIPGNIGPSVVQVNKGNRLSIFDRWNTAPTSLPDEILSDPDDYKDEDY